MGFISAALCYFATKPKTNRIPIMRAHMAMAFINIVVAAVALTVILGTVQRLKRQLVDRSIVYEAVDRRS